MEKINNDLAEQSKQSGKKISKVTFIFDMDELSMRQVAYKPSNSVILFKCAFSLLISQQQWTLRGKWFTCSKLTIRKSCEKPISSTVIQLQESKHRAITVMLFAAPKLYTMVFNVLRPFMHQATINKINIFGHDKREWLPAMLEEIDASQLPVLYGGTLTDPDGDPNCPSMVFALKALLEASSNVCLTVQSRRRSTYILLHC